MCTWENAPHTTTNQRYSESKELQMCLVTQAEESHIMWNIVAAQKTNGPAPAPPSRRLSRLQAPLGAADQHRPRHPPTGEMPLRPRPHYQQFRFPRQR